VGEETERRTNLLRWNKTILYPKHNPIFSYTHTNSSLCKQPWKSTQLYTHLSKCPHIHTQTFIYIHKHICIYTNKNKHSCTTHAHTYTHTCIYSLYNPVYFHTPSTSHVYGHTHVDMQRHIQTYTHILTVPHTQNHLHTHYPPIRSYMFHSGPRYCLFMELYMKVNTFIPNFRQYITGQ
jgi:hypothetical protein